MTLSLLSHISLDVLDRAVAHAYYIDGLGAVEDPSSSSEFVLCANAGASQIHMRIGAVAQVWAGHIELWTRESLDTVRARLTRECQEVIRPLLELQQQATVQLPELLDDIHGQRILCKCPYGNTLLVRRVPPSYYIYAHGSHPGGIGGLVAMTRLVHIVTPGTARSLQAFWSSILGSSRAELVERPPVGDGLPPTAHAVVRFSSGQQIIFDEREGGPAANARDTDSAAAYSICVYIDSVDSFKQTFDACEDARALYVSPELDDADAASWASAEASGEFRIKDMPAALPDETREEEDEAREVALAFEIAIRSVAHKACPLPRADIVAGGGSVEPPAAFAGASPLQPPPHAKPGVIRIPHGRGGFGVAARDLARDKRNAEARANYRSRVV